MATAIAGGKKRATIGIRSVPSPKPLKKVRSAAKNDADATMIISTISLF